MLDVELSKHDAMQMLGASLHLQTTAPNLPTNHAWLVDLFLVAFSMYLLDGEEYVFMDRVERIINYIIDHRKEEKTKPSVSDET